MQLGSIEFLIIGILAVIGVAIKVHGLVLCPADRGLELPHTLPEVEIIECPVRQLVPLVVVDLVDLPDVLVIRSNRKCVFIEPVLGRLDPLQGLFGRPVSHLDPDLGHGHIGQDHDSGHQEDQVATRDAHVRPP